MVSLANGVNKNGAATPEREWAATRSVVSVADLACVVLVAGTIFCFIAKSSRYGLFADDWRLSERGQNLGDFFQAYNGNLSVVPIAVYRLVNSVFGFSSYLPLRVVGIVSGTLVGGAVFLLVRTRLGPVPALIAAASMSWYPGFVILPVAFNYYFALLATIYCAWLLTQKGGNADVPLVLTLSFALCCSGVGVAGAVGCLVYVALARAPLRRWLSVLVPTLAWGVWWLFVSTRDRGPHPRTFSQSLHFTRDGITGSFQGLVLDNRLLGVVLGILFLVNLGRALRRGPVIARHQLAWTAALCAWWIGLSYSRGLLASSDTVRYRFVGSAFVILAFLPAQRPSRLLWKLRRVGIVAGLIVAGLVVYANHGGIFRDARALESQHRRVRQNLIVANLGPQIVPDRVLIPLGGYASLSAGEYRNLVVKFGTPPGTRPQQPDVALIALGGYRFGIARGQRPGACVPLAGEAQVAPTSTTVLEASKEDVVVQLRRFGHILVMIGRVPAGATATIDLPGLQATTPWTIAASGACMVRDAVTIDRPKNGATLTGTIPLVASAPRDISSVEFRLTGRNHSNMRIGAALPGYGWSSQWDTTTVPNGRYTLTSTATDSLGKVTTSAEVSITVHN